MQTNWLVSIWYKFLLKDVSKQTIELWVLIQIIPQNIFKLHVAKIHTKYDKICVATKIHKKIFSRKEIFFSVVQKNHALTCPGLYRMILQLYITKMANWWKSKSLKLLHIVHRQICHVFVVYWHPIFKREKQSDRSNKACCKIR